jgi:hypothetical protein
MSAAQRPFLTASNRCEPPGQTVALDEARSNELETLVNWTLALSDGRGSCIHPHKAGLFALEDDAIHRSCGHSGAVEADCEARVPG